MKTFLATEADTLALGRCLQACIRGSCVVFLRGDLGAGKTTLVRGFLRAAGYSLAVKSPTFTLVEEYRLEHQSIFHFDLYRLVDPEEIEWMGLRDYLTGDAVCFFEWPEKGLGFLPAEDIEVGLRTADAGRVAVITPHSRRGHSIVAKLSIKCFDQR